MGAAATHAGSWYTLLTGNEDKFIICIAPGDIIGTMETGDAAALHADADKIIRAMYAGEMSWAARERAQEKKLTAIFASVREDDAATASLYRLVYGLPRPRQRQDNRLLNIEPVLPNLGPQAGNTGMDALLHFARFSHRWLRPPEQWEPDADGAQEQVHSLTRHLFARYAMPKFLDAAWLSGFGAQAETCREWFTHLGDGGKLEAISFPLPMTHKAAHFFLLAPADFSIPSALRFGQYRALGANDALIRAVAETFLADLQPDEDFWFSVAQFLVNNPRLPLMNVGPVLDFLRFCKFGGTNGGASDGSDADPNFSMKGRTLDALTRRMDDWHATLARMGLKSKMSWKPSGLAEWDKTVKDPLSSAQCRWRIAELTESVSLAEEGSILRHCVRSYQDGCLKGDKAIFSLRCSLSDTRTVRRLLTIEVNLRRRAVVQVRGKCNQTLSAMRRNRRMMLARDVLKEWARSQHLGIVCGL